MTQLEDERFEIPTWLWFKKACSLCFPAGSTLCSCVGPDWFCSAEAGEWEVQANISHMGRHCFYTNKEMDKVLIWLSDTQSLSSVLTLSPYSWIYFKEKQFPQCSTLGIFLHIFLGDFLLFPPVSSPSWICGYNVLSCHSLSLVQEILSSCQHPGDGA